MDNVKRTILVMGKGRLKVENEKDFMDCNEVNYVLALALLII